MSENKEGQLKEIFKEKKSIILLGGVAGTGKTMMGNLLLNSLELDHSIGTGWIREVYSINLDKKKYPELFTHSFRPIKKRITPVENFRRGTKSLLPAIEACVKRARREGTSLLIEGVYLMPDVNEGLYDFFFLLKKAEDIKIYANILTGKSHNKRPIYKSDIQGSLEIEKELIKVCEKTNTPIIPFMKNEKRKKMIIDIIAKKLGVLNGC